MSLLQPALRRAIDQAKLVVCMNHQRQLILGMQAYSDDFNGKLLPGYRAANLPDYRVHDEGWLLNVESYELFRDDYIAGNNTYFSCPNLSQDLDLPNTRLGYGVVLGYNYWGDKPGINDSCQTEFPMGNLANANPNAPLFSDLNNWSPRFKRLLVAHKDGGEGELYAWWFKDGTTSEINPVQAGSLGGHCGYADGRVTWYDISDMEEYRVIQPYLEGFEYLPIDMW